MEFAKSLALILFKAVVVILIPYYWFMSTVEVRPFPEEISSIISGA